MLLEYRGKLLVCKNNLLQKKDLWYVVKNMDSNTDINVLMNMSLVQKTMNECQCKYDSDIMAKSETYNANIYIKSVTLTSS